MLSIAIKRGETATIGEDAVKLLSCSPATGSVSVRIGNATAQSFADPDSIPVDGGRLYVIRVSRIRASLGYQGTAAVIYPHKKRSTKTYGGAVYRATPPKRGKSPE